MFYRLNALDKLYVITIAIYFRIFKWAIGWYYLKKGYWCESGPNLSIVFFIRNASKTIDKFSNLLKEHGYPRVSTSNNELLTKIREGYSLSRFGDGEYAILKANIGNRVYFDTATLGAKKRLLEVLTSPIEKHVVALIHEDVVASQLIFSNVLSQFKSIKSLFYGARMPIFSEFDNDMLALYRSLGERPCVYEAGLLRNSTHAEHISLWGERNVLYVTGSRETSEKYGYTVEQIFFGAKSVDTIETVTEQALSRNYDEILNKVIQHDNVGSKMIFISQGMAGSVLAYDLAKLGLQAIDFGQPFINYKK